MKQTIFIIGEPVLKEGMLEQKIGYIKGYDSAISSAIVDEGTSDEEIETFIRNSFEKEVELKKISHEGWAKKTKIKN